MTQMDSSSQLEMQVLSFVRNQSADGRIQAMILDLVNQALRVQNVALSHTEKERLAIAVQKSILAEMLAKLA